jgi:hypothetical protein
MDPRHFFYDELQVSPSASGQRLERLLRAFTRSAPHDHFGDTPVWAKEGLREEVRRTTPHVLWVDLVPQSRSGRRRA